MEVASLTQQYHSELTASDVSVISALIRELTAAALHDAEVKR